MNKMFSLFGTIGVEGVTTVLKGFNSIDKEAKELSKELNKLGKKCEDVGKSFTKFVTIPILAFGAAAYKGVKAASDLNETVSKVGEIFKGSASDIEKWAETSAKGLGQSKTQAMDAASTFAIFAKSAGLTGKELVNFSTKFVKLAGDLASFNNTSPEDAIIAIGAAMRGENEPIRRYGVLLDDASLRQQAMKMGIIDTIKNALTPQQKVLAASELIFKQTATAQGDFERTSKGLANQQRILKAEIANMTAEFGTAFLPMALRLVSTFRNDVLPVVKKLIDFFKNMPDAAKQFIFGMGIVLAVMGPLLIAFGSLIKSAFVLRGAVLLLNGAMMANPIGIVIGAVLALSAAWIACTSAANAYHEKQKENSRTAGLRQEAEELEDIKKKLEQTIKTQEALSKTGGSLYNPESLEEARMELVAINKALQDNAAEMAGKTPISNLITTPDSVGGGVDTTEEEKRKIEELRKARQKMVQDYKDQMSEMSDSEGLRLEKSRVAAIAEARSIGMSEEGIQSIEEVYAQKKINLANKVLAEKKKTYQEEGLAQNKRLDDEYNKEKIADNEKLQLDLQTEKRLRQQKEDYFSDLEEMRKTELKQENLSQKAIYNINKYYDNEIRKGKKKLALDFMNSLSSVISKIGQLFAMSTQNQIDAIDNQTQIQTNAINSQLISQEEKDKKIAELNKKADEEKKALQLEEFKRQKAIAIISAIVGTAVAVVNALANSGNPYLGIAMAVIVGALGAVEIALIASQPDPMAEGGLVMSNPGPGHVARIGEGNENELVLPMKTGVNMLANNLIEKMSSINPFNNGNGFLGLGGNNTTNNTTGGNVNNNFNIGTLIGDERGFKELTRKIIPILKSENQRKALAAV